MVTLRLPKGQRLQQAGRRVLCPAAVRPFQILPGPQIVRSALTVEMQRRGIELDPGRVRKCLRRLQDLLRARIKAQHPPPEILLRVQRIHPANLAAAAKCVKSPSGPIFPPCVYQPVNYIGEVKPECETRLKLLRVAGRLIWENSYHAVSVDDICRQAEVKKGSFYHFFPSKSDLTVAAMEAGWQERQPDLDRVFSPQTPPLERIGRFCDGLYEMQAAKKAECGKVCGCPNVTLGSELSTQDENIRRKAADIMTRYVRYLESALREALAEGVIADTDPLKAAQDLFAYSQGLLLQAKVLNDPEILRGARAGMFRLLHLVPVPVA